MEVKALIYCSLLLYTSHLEEMVVREYFWDILLALFIVFSRREDSYSAEASLGLKVFFNEELWIAFVYRIVSKLQRGGHILLLIEIFFGSSSALGI